MEQIDSAISSTTVSEYSKMSQEEFKRLILMGKKLAINWFILSLICLIIFFMLLVGIATVKTMINVKFAPSQKFSATSKRMSKGISLTNFLFWYSTKLCNELLQLFDQKKDCIECFQGEYEYHGHDRNSGDSL